MNRRTLLSLGATALASSLAGCAGGIGPVRVRMTEDFAFAPETATVEPGTTVRWPNESEVGHTVTAYGDRIPDDASYFASGGFTSERAARNDIEGGIVDPGETYEHTFETPGRYDYFCIPHESSGMVGTVRVRE